MGGDRLRRRVLGPDLRSGPWRGSVPPEHVHLLETHRSAALAADVRRARAGVLYRPAVGDEYAAPGAGADERPRLRRGGAQAGRAADDGGRNDAGAAYRLCVSAGASAAAEG